MGVRVVGSCGGCGRLLSSMPRSPALRLVWEILDLMIKDSETEVTIWGFKGRRQTRQGSRYEGNHGSTKPSISRLRSREMWNMRKSSSRTVSLYVQEDGPWTDCARHYIRSSSLSDAESSILGSKGRTCADQPSRREKGWKGDDDERNVDP